MKVALIARSTLYSGKGGDTVQIVKTAEYLRKLGVEADIILSGEPVDYSNYDLLHFFNIIRPDDIISHVRKSNLPFVISTIYVDYSVLDMKIRGVLFRTLYSVLGRDRVEYLKAVARWIKSGEAITSKDYLLRGHRNCIRYLIQKANLMLPNSQSEINRLMKDYNCSGPFKVIPNAVDAAIFDGSNTQSGKERKGVISVGRFEYRKNQLNLIRALKNTDHTLTLVGDPSPNQISYYEQCMEEAKELGDRFKLFSFMEHDKLVELFSEQRVHVLASWFETTGLVSLEAAMQGCEIVITNRGDTEEYFGKYAFYCDPESPDSIREAVESSFKESRLGDFQDHIRANYTWERTAEKTLQAYKEVLGE
ncbi:glycosyltransferase family 4 protein [bacterium SCSIO 12741]|nr:glycosyltransferase family 4 protein [bacterium SCSIO 12741]